jgi:ketol-acid reductoisomerase
MNRIISDTAEYGCYLFDHAAKPLLTDFMKTQVTPEEVGLGGYGHEVENKTLIQVNQEIAEHPIEHVGKRLRLAMTAMKTLNTK